MLNGKEEKLNFDILFVHLYPPNEHFYYVLCCMTLNYVDLSFYIYKTGNNTRARMTVREREREETKNMRENTAIFF